MNTAKLTMANPAMQKIAESIQSALDNHAKLSKSYFWSNNGNAQARRRREKESNFTITVEVDGHEYRYESHVRISTKNFYYTGFFERDGERRDVRLFKKLLDTLGPRREMVYDPLHQISRSLYR